MMKNRNVPRGLGRTYVKRTYDLNHKKVLEDQGR